MFCRLGAANGRRTLLLMAAQDVQTRSFDDVPDANRAVVRARDTVAAVSSNRPDSVCVALKAVIVEGVLVRRDGVIWVARSVGLERTGVSDAKLPADGVPGNSHWTPCRHPLVGIQARPYPVGAKRGSCCRASQ